MKHTWSDHHQNSFKFGFDIHADICKKNFIENSEYYGSLLLDDAEGDEFANSVSIASFATMKQKNF